MFYGCYGTTFFSKTIKIDKTFLVKLFSLVNSREFKYSYIFNKYNIRLGLNFGEIRKYKFWVFQF